MTGFGSGSLGSIELLDLDTIDLSNLNRQFLFQKQHVKRPKSIVAKETALKFNPHVKITALHRNIKDVEEFNVDYFKQFDFVMNALDNLDARRHVNKMCLASNVPLIESGTSGYRGQVQPIKGGNSTTDCFDCTGKPVPKTFAVCTIRSTPSTAHHCIAWSKSYLFPQLFGSDDELESDQSELDQAEKNGENLKEIESLRKEGLAIQELKSSLSKLSPDDAAKRIFEKVFEKDIERLLEMSDMWNHRKPPHTLSFTQLSKALEEKRKNDDDSTMKKKDEGGGEGTIKDQRKLSLQDSFELFIDSVERLQKRIDPTGQTSISFDKDDQDTLDFVVSTANLRASCFSIESQTKFQVKEYAGNIIPAIATTNAIIAGAIVLQSLAHLKNEWNLARSVWLNRQSDKIFDVGPCSTPNPFCAVCRIVYVPMRFKKDLKLGEFVKAITNSSKEEEGSLNLGGEEERISIMEGTRLLFETEDFEDNETEQLVESLNCGIGKFLTVENDDNDWPISFSIGSFLPEDSTERFQFDLSNFPSKIPKKPTPPPATTEEEKTNTSGGGGNVDDDITFTVDEDQDDLMIIEPKTTSSSSDANNTREAQIQQSEAIAGQIAVTEEPGRITGKKRSANEAQLGEGGEGEGEGEGDKSPPKKEKKRNDDDGEKKIEVVDLT
jgi:ubiquitin-like 1-activating enzyme E1 B